jgi:hypothetical protein
MVVIGSIRLLSLHKDENEVEGAEIWQKKIVAFSPQANYTDWATATCRRNLVPTFADREVSRGQRGGSSTVVNFSFIDRSLYFFFQVSPHLSSRGWVDPVPDPLLRRKFGSAVNRTHDLWVSCQELWTLDHRGDRRFDTDADGTKLVNKKHFQDAFPKPQTSWDQCVRSRGDSFEGDGAN